MKKILQICLIVLGVLTCYFFVNTVSAGVVNIPGSSDIEAVSIDYTGGGDPVNAISNTGFRILTTIKVLLQGILIIMVVYTGFMMIYSMGNDEETLSKAKRQIWYFLVALLFINIPGTLYEAFYKNGSTTV